MRPLPSQAAFVALTTSLATALPHDGSMDMGNMHATHSVPHPTVTAIHATPDRPMSYFATGKHSSSIIGHIALMVLGWCFVLPIAVMLSIARSRLTLPSQFLFLVINAFGLVLGIVYNSQTPDLYENNAHHKLGWLVTCVVGAQVVLALLFAYASRSESNPASHDHVAFLSVSTDEHENDRIDRNAAMHEHCWSLDSGQGTEHNSPSIVSPGSPSYESSAEYDGFEMPELPEKMTAPGWANNTGVGHFLSKRLPSLIACQALRWLNVVYNIVDRIILPFGFAAIVSGAVTYGGTMRGRDVFNGLAHFIKGGIFFWYGVLSLGRFIGCWAYLGWAWNKKPSASIVGDWKSKVPSGEATESFVIFLYGVTNVFLENLSNAGQTWSLTDPEHVSISVLFFGGGLAGMVLESTRIRGWLKNTILPAPANATSDDTWQPPKSQGMSLNPIPALAILLLGTMMGSHYQDSITSTMVHKQWSYMLIGFAIARGMTYVLLYLKPPTSYPPARPTTEIIAAFCLLSGGLIFMLSTRNVIEAMEYYQVDAVFTFTVGLCFSAFIMAYVEVFFITLKAWSVNRIQHPRLSFEEPPEIDNYMEAIEATSA